MNARFAVVAAALSLAANACGTIVSPDVAPADAALSDEHHRRRDCRRC